VTIKKKDNSFGFNLKSVHTDDGIIEVIYRCKPHALKKGLSEYCQLVQVNNSSIKDLDHSQVVAQIKNAGKTITLLVHKLDGTMLEAAKSRANSVASKSVSRKPSVISDKPASIKEESSASEAAPESSSPVSARVEKEISMSRDGGRLGFTLQKLDDGTFVLIEVISGGLGHEAGVQEDDVVVQIGDHVLTGDDGHAEMVSLIINSDPVSMKVNQLVVAPAPRGSVSVMSALDAASLHEASIHEEEKSVSRRASSVVEVMKEHSRTSSIRSKASSVKLVEHVAVAAAEGDVQVVVDLENSETASEKPADAQSIASSAGGPAAEEDKSESTIVDDAAPEESSIHPDSATADAMATIATTTAAFATTGGRVLTIVKPPAGESCGFTAKDTAHGKIYIDRVVIASAADEAGLQIGDVVHGFDDLDALVRHVREAEESFEFDVTYDESYIPDASETTSLATSIATTIQLDDAPVTMPRTLTVTSEHPGMVELPPSVAVSRVSSFRAIHNFEDKKTMAGILGSQVAKKASVSGTNDHSEADAVVDDVEIKEKEVFQAFDTALKTAALSDKEESDPIHSHYLGTKPIEEDMRSLLDLHLDNESVQIPKLGKLLDRWRLREEQGYTGRPASGSISGRTSGQPLPVRKDITNPETFRPKFNHTVEMVILEEGEE